MDSKIFPITRPYSFFNDAFCDTVITNLDNFSKPAYKSVKQCSKVILKKQMNIYTYKHSFLLIFLGAREKRYTPKSSLSALVWDKFRFLTVTVQFQTIMTMELIFLFVLKHRNGTRLTTSAMYSSDNIYINIFYQMYQVRVRQEKYYLVIA